MGKERHHAAQDRRGGTSAAAPPPSRDKGPQAQSPRGSRITSNSGTVQGGARRGQAGPGGACSPTRPGLALRKLARGPRRGVANWITPAAPRSRGDGRARGHIGPGLGPLGPGRGPKEPGPRPSVMQAYCQIGTSAPGLDPVTPMVRVRHPTRFHWVADARQPLIRAPEQPTPCIGQWGHPL